MPKRKNPMKLKTKLPLEHRICVEALLDTKHYLQTTIEKYAAHIKAPTAVRKMYQKEVLSNLKHTLDHIDDEIEFYMQHAQKGIING